MRAEGIIGAFEHAVIGPYRGVRQSIVFGRTPGPEPFAAPTLGQHDVGWVDPMCKD